MLNWYMYQYSTLYWLLLSSSVAYLISISHINSFIPQIIAGTIIILIIFRQNRVQLVPLISLVCNLVVFSSGGISSPFYFLIYFLLFSTAFILNPISSLVFSLTTVLLLGQTLVNINSLYSLLSILFIAPLVWLISQETQKVIQNQKTIAQDETDFLLWLSLKFKTGITNIIDLSSQLQSSPLNYSQKEHIKKIRTSAKSLLNSSQKLTAEISSQDDEI